MHSRHVVVLPPTSEFTIPNLALFFMSRWAKELLHITEVNDKFAWLETKFPVGSDPKVDEFLYGPATALEWTQFLAYLRKEHGRTKQQKAAVFLDGLKRDGRRPSQYVATLDEKTNLKGSNSQMAHN